MSAEELLTQLPPGHAATVLAIDDSGPVGRRLLDLGLLPGTSVRALRHAPLGDPGLYELRGYQLCLRRSETDRIRVKRDPDG
jgi:Fe2+ transport system protein FeoA